LTQYTVEEVGAAVASGEVFATGGTGVVFRTFMGDQLVAIKRVAYVVHAGVGLTIDFSSSDDVLLEGPRSLRPCALSCCTHMDRCMCREAFGLQMAPRDMAAREISVLGVVSRHPNIVRLRG
jgi:hypothetical protein